LSFLYLLRILKLKSTGQKLLTSPMRVTGLSHRHHRRNKLMFVSESQLRNCEVFFLVLLVYPPPPLEFSFTTFNLSALLLFPAS
jgi:hypothetical protein